MASPVLPLPPLPSILQSNSHASDVNPSSLPNSPPKHNFKATTIRFRLSQLCQEAQPLIARQLFDTLPRPSTVLWNTIIIGFICNNMPNEALSFYCKMKSSPAAKGDSYTYSSILKACAESRDLRYGKAVHAHFLRCELNPSRIVYNSLLNMYSVCSTMSDSEVVTSVNAGLVKSDYVLKLFVIMRKRNVVAWNTVISWYAKTERYVEAVRQFRLMAKMGTKPSPVSFVNVFPAVSSLRDCSIADMFYGFLLKLGREYFSDSYVVSSAIIMYSELDRLDLARKIFNQCTERNTAVWNTIIGIYVQNNCPVQSIELFIQALELEEVALDDVTFLSGLTAVSQLQQVEIAEQIHAFILKSYAFVPVIISNAIIVMYSRCNSIYKSFELFHKMVQRDIVSWNTMIFALVQNGKDEEALMLVYEMQKLGFTVDSVTVTALLSASSNLRRKDIGKQTHAYLTRHGIEFEGMESYLVDMYAKSGLVRTAEQLFAQNHASDRDQATWNSMISGYAQNGLHEEALITFRNMLEKYVMPNSVTLASILSTCGSIGSTACGKQLHGFSVRHFLDQSVFVGTALIDSYSKCGSISYAEKVFMKTPERNSVTYTAMVLGFGHHGMAEKAVTLFHSMKGTSIKPDAITLVAVLSACNYNGLIDDGLKIFLSMEKEYNIEPSTEHYCCVADMLGRVGRVTEAYEFVTALGQKSDVPEIWGTLLGACRNHEYHGLAKPITDKLLKFGSINSMTGYNVLLSNIYAEEGEWENVNRLREGMKEQGLRKEKGCSWIEISGIVNCFLSMDQKHLQSVEIYDMLEKLTLEMKYVGYLPFHGAKVKGILEFDE